jgi:hypothetical protein
MAEVRLDDDVLPDCSSFCTALLIAETSSLSKVLPAAADEPLDWLALPLAEVVAVWFAALTWDHH